MERTECRVPLAGRCRDTDDHDRRGSEEFRQILVHFRLFDVIGQFLSEGRGESSVHRSFEGRATNLNRPKIVERQLNELFQFGKSLSIDGLDEVVNQIDFIVDLDENAIGIDNEQIFWIVFDDPFDFHLRDPMMILIEDDLRHRLGEQRRIFQFGDRTDSIRGQVGGSRRFRRRRRRRRFPSIDVHLLTIVDRLLPFILVDRFEIRQQFIGQRHSRLLPSTLK